MVDRYTIHTGAGIDQIKLREHHQGTRTPTNTFAPHTNTRPTLNSSFWQFVHPADQPGLLARVSHAILTQEGPARRLRCRLRRGCLGGCKTWGAGTDGEYHPFALGLAYGTQGLVCTLWEGGEGDEEVGACSSPVDHQQEASLERARQQRRLEEGYFTFVPPAAAFASSLR